MMESLGESTYIVPFRASRRRRRSTSTSNRRRAATFEDHSSTSGREGGVGEGVGGGSPNESTSSNSSSIRSDSAPPLSPSQSPQSTSTTSNISNYSYRMRDNAVDSNSAVGYREMTTTATTARDAHDSLSTTPAAAVLEESERALMESAHWPQALSDSELYLASPTPSSIAALTPTATTRSGNSSNNNNSNSNTAADHTYSASDITHPSIQEQEQDKKEADLSDPDCAICLDRIVPLRHAKAILACRHEFHLSCISMAFAMGKEMICPLCRYLHKDQPFMTLESEEDLKPTSTNRRSPVSSPSSSSHSQTSTLHEHPTSGTVLSMMPSLFETSLGHGPTAGTIRTAPNGICLRTSTWLLLYALPFTVALCFLAFVLGKVETLWSKISCLIGAAICYMVCWALVVAIMDPDHEARAILERLDQDQRRRAILQAMQGGNGITEIGASGTSGGDSSIASRAALELTRRRTGGSDVDYLSNSPSPAISNDGFEQDASARQMTGAEAEPDPGWPYSVAGWVPHRYAQDIQNRLLDFSEMLDRVPDMMGEW
ncbi:hypothetical protein BKA57DRAFT_539088 [Linnemannia elongata]|nr:hypothetical protein BKA57DRAFT_539088 [Linnemannia elongata]